MLAELADEEAAVRGSPGGGYAVWSTRRLRLRGDCVIVAFGDSRDTSLTTGSFDPTCGMIAEVRSAIAKFQAVKG